MSTAKRQRTKVPHPRAIQRAQSQRPTAGPPDEQIEARLQELIHPATYAQVAAYQAMGLRERVLTLPVMVACVLSLIWRQIGSVSEAVRVLEREGLLWTGPVKVTQQAMSQRLRSVPASLFAQVFEAVVPLMQQRWAERQRPLLAVMARAQAHFTMIVTLDGSTLATLLRKVGLLREGQGPVVAGRMAALLDLASRLPRQLWYEEERAAHDQRFWERVLAVLVPKRWLVFDLGLLNHEIFDRLTEREVRFITRAKQNGAYHVTQTLTLSANVHDQIVIAGSRQKRCAHPLRLVELNVNGGWYRYLTNVLDPLVLTAQDVMALYAQRWRVEDAFNIVKRLLGLAYFWVGSINGVQVQLWATWLLYAVLVDLTDAVAQELKRPFAALSIEMVFRGLYHFTQAFHRGQASDPIAYLAAHAKGLGIIKRPRSRTSPARVPT